MGVLTVKYEQRLLHASQGQHLKKKGIDAHNKIRVPCTQASDIGHKASNINISSNTKNLWHYYYTLTGNWQMLMPVPLLHRPNR